MLSEGLSDGFWTILLLIFELLKLVNDIANKTLGFACNILLLETSIIRRVTDLKIDEKLMAVDVP